MRFLIARNLKEIEGTGKWELSLLKGNKEIFVTEEKEKALGALSRIIKDDPKGGWFLLGISYPKIEINVSLDEGKTS